MSVKPLISVVSASWNQGRYIEECLKSVQGLPDGVLEHLVVDNCSDDETHEVLKKYPQVRAIIEPDSGQSNALNKGFQAARGEWILWLNVDDYLQPGAIEEYYAVLQSKGENLDMIYGHMVFVDGNSRYQKTVFQPQWYYWMTRNAGFVAPSTGSLYRRKVLIDYPLDEDFHMIMDTEWMLRAGRDLRVKRIRRSMVSFRIADNKTAQHINEGVVTPRHQKERMEVAARYPGYHLSENSDYSLSERVLQKLMRSSMRIWIKLDKLCSLISKKLKI